MSSGLVNLVWSIKNGDAENVKEIFDKEVYCIDIFIVLSIADELYVYFFLYKQHLRIQKLDVNIVIDGRRPIHYAADYGQKEIIEYLIDQLGSDVNVSSKISSSKIFIT